MDRKRAEVRVVGLQPQDHRDAALQTRCLHRGRRARLVADVPRLRRTVEAQPDLSVSARRYEAPCDVVGCSNIRVLGIEGGLRPGCPVPNRIHSCILPSILRRPGSPGYTGQVAPGESRWVGPMCPSRARTGRSRPAEKPPGFSPSGVSPPGSVTGRRRDAPHPSGVAPRASGRGPAGVGRGRQRTRREGRGAGWSCHAAWPMATSTSSRQGPHRTSARAAPPPGSSKGR